MPAELYGPAGALVALATVLLAIIRGDLVPGWIYKAAIAREEKSNAQAEKNAEALATLAKASSGRGSDSKRA